MKVYLKENGVTIVGKAWQVKRVLQQYMKEFDTVDQWTRSTESEKVIRHIG